MCKYCVNHKKYDDDVEEKYIISKAVRTFFGSIYFDQYIGQGNELKFVFTADSEAKVVLKKKINYCPMCGKNLNQ